MQNVSRALTFAFVIRLISFLGMALYFMVGPEDGKLTKEDVRRLFEGRLFYEIAERNKKFNAEKKDV